MAAKLLAKAGLIWRFFVYTLGSAFAFFRRTRALKKRQRRQQALGRKEAAAASGHGKKPPQPPQDAEAAAAATQPQQQPPQQPRNIVVVGASFAGYHVARQVAAGLPEGAAHRVVVVEPSSHFHWTWVLPRVCAVEGHEHKAFIPYGPHLAGAASPGRLRWVTGRVASASRGSVRLEGDDGEVIPYDYLVVATGSGVGAGLPSRVGAADREGGLGRIREVQRRVAAAGRVVVVGGGAAGVELAADAKARHRDKDVVLVHSRPAVMHRFGPELQAAALEGLRGLGVEVVLGERASVDADGRLVTLLRSGRKIECDLFISCAGQRPASDVLAGLSPGSISESGHVRVLPTLQVADDSLPNVFACGDVADTGTANPNGRAAVKQAEVVADNILAMAVGGGRPCAEYKAHWADGAIKLTMGLEKSIVQFGDEKTEFFWHSKDKDVALGVDGAWRHLGAVPFEDTTDELAQYRQL
ncbi:hypothetical protein RB595_005733 [Gaeumannomyces hyphopodioides]